jgi:hypothetical protein
MRRFIYKLKAVLCRHSVVRVIRRHALTVPRYMRSRLLYVDRHNVHCFVQCTHCNKVLRVAQTERLYEERA